MQQSNIVYGSAYPSSSNNNFYHQYPPNPGQLVYVDGVWHRIPLTYYGNGAFPEPHIFFSHPQDFDNYNSYDYRNAMILEEITDEQKADPRVKRLSSADITEEDLAFLNSSEKVLFNLEESSPNSSGHDSPSSSPTNLSFSPIFLSPSPPRLNTPSNNNNRKPTRSNAKRNIKTSPTTKRTYRKSSNHHGDDNLPKVIIPRIRKQPPPLRISSLDISRGFVGYCGVLKVNPYFIGCPGRITTIKDKVGYTYFTCANCGTRRRYLEESDSCHDILELD
jgi:hypothetical protein